MTPRTSTRPIRRVAESREPYIPAGPKRILDALRPIRHQLRPGEDIVLAFAKWMDLHAISDLRRLDEEVIARLSRADHARHRVGPFDRHDRIGECPGDRDRHGATSTPLWMAPAGAPADGAEPSPSPADTDARAGR